MNSILWLDMESTGLDPEYDHVLEVAVVVTDRDLEPLFRWQTIVQPSDLGAARFRMEATPERVVAEMHDANGLWSEIMDGAGIRLATAEAELEKIARRWADPSLGDALAPDGRIPLAGSGISHYDREVIKRQMPRLEACLTYWMYDVGQVGRFARDLADGPPRPERAEGAKKHRAMADVEAAIEEARTLTQWMNRGFECAEAEGTCVLG